MSQSTLFLLKNKPEFESYNDLNAKAHNDAEDKIPDYILTESELDDAIIAAKIAEIDEQELAANIAAIDAAAIDAAADDAATSKDKAEITDDATNEVADVGDAGAGDAAADDAAAYDAAADDAAADDAAPKLTAKQIEAHIKIQLEIERIKLDREFVQDGVTSLEQISREFGAKILVLYDYILSLLYVSLAKLSSKRAIIPVTAEMLQCLKFADEFDNGLKIIYDSEVLLPGSQKTLVEFIKMGTDVVIMRIEYSSFFKAISFEGKSIEDFLNECSENSTKMIGRQLSPSAAKCRYAHMGSIPAIAKAIASYVRSSIGASCDDIFTVQFYLELSNRLSVIYDSNIVQKAFSNIRIPPVIEEAAIEYASAISAATPVKSVSRENTNSFVQIAKIAGDLFTTQSEQPSEKEPQRPKESIQIELFYHLNYNGKLVCASCVVRSASTNQSRANGEIGEPLFPIYDDKRNFVGGLCQMCAHCVSHKNNWQTIVPMSTELIKRFSLFANKSFEAKKIAINDLRKSHLNCNKCKSMNGRVFNARTNELKFGVYCINCVSEVYIGIYGCRPVSRNDNQELYEDFTFNNQKYLEVLGKRA